VKGEGQGRGNSGVYFQGRYEIQVLDSWNNPTYSNGQAAAFYGHNAPKVNASRKPGEWQSYDIVFHPPKPAADGSVTPGSFTVFHNGVLVQDHIPIKGDATTSAKDLAEACSLDAGMTASLLRTANSAFYGLSGRVTTVQFAISVIGFTSVRALAAVSVVDDDTVPSEWWIASSLHAVAAGHVAPRVGALSPDAFCAGLLCDIGRPMLRKVHPSDYDALCTRAIHPDDLPKLEREWAERSHTDVAAEMFSQWNFPELLVDAIAQHHDPIKAVQPEPLRLAVRIGQEISSRISGARPRENIERITKGALSEPEVAAMTRKIKEEAAGIRMALGL
jgi:putative nucleotidyltransferase with HDIG domain